MNNEVFSIDAKNELEPTLREANRLYGDLKQKLKAFLDVAITMKVSDTRGFREIKQQRDKFRNKLTMLQRKCESLHKKKSEISKYIADLTDMKKKKEALDLTKYTKKKIATKSDQETLVAGSEIFKGCACMENDNCKECKHHYTNHVHLKVKWVKKEEETSVLDEEQVKLIERASTDIGAKEKLLKSLRDSVNKCQKEIAAKQKEITELIRQMKKICSGFNYAKEIDLSITILEERIEYLQSRNDDEGVAAIQADLQIYKKIKELVRQR